MSEIRRSPVSNAVADSRCEAVPYHLEGRPNVFYTAKIRAFSQISENIS